MRYFNTFICIYVHDSDSVTYGKSYDVYHYTDYLLYIDDLGEEYLFSPISNIGLNGSKFITLEEWRDNQLKELGI